MLSITALIFNFTYLSIPIIRNNLSIILSIFYLYALFIGEILVSTLAVVSIFIASLLTISKSISQLGIYHTLKNSDNIRGEDFSVKVIKVFIWNCILTVFVFISIIDVIKPTSEIIQKIPALTQHDIAFFSAIFIIPGYLLSLRLLANPGKWFIDHPLNGLFTQPDAEKESVKIFKERILSFYFSLTVIVFIYIVIKYFFEGLVHLEDPNQFAGQFLSAYIPQLPIFILSILPYLVALALTTLIGEIVLRVTEPIDQIKLNF